MNRLDVSNKDSPRVPHPPAESRQPRFPFASSGADLRESRWQVLEPRSKEDIRISELRSSWFAHFEEGLNTVNESDREFKNHRIGMGRERSLESSPPLESSLSHRDRVLSFFKSDLDSLSPLANELNTGEMSLPLMELFQTDQEDLRIPLDQPRSGPVLRTISGTSFHSDDFSLSSHESARMNVSFYAPPEEELRVFSSNRPGKKSAPVVTFLLAEEPVSSPNRIRSLSKAQGWKSF